MQLIRMPYLVHWVYQEVCRIMSVFLVSGIFSNTSLAMLGKNYGLCEDAVRPNVEGFNRHKPSTLKQSTQQRASSGRTK